MYTYINRGRPPPYHLPENAPETGCVLGTPSIPVAETRLDHRALAAAVGPGDDTPIPLAHGERELTRFTVRDFIVEGGIRYVQFDATRAAGFTEALRIAQLAEQHGVMLAPHTAPELHGHLVLASPRCVFGVESHGGPEYPELRDGHLHFGDRPGFGIEVDWAFVNRYRLRTKMRR